MSATPGTTHGSLMDRAPNSADTVHHQRAGRSFLLRPCVGFEELDSCVRLQQLTWGYPDIQVVPRNMFVLAQTLGGHVLGAWDEQRQLAGFAMAIAAHAPPALGYPAGTRREGADDGPAEPPSPYLHSHMLAVRPEYQNLGLGSALKQAQRQDALRRGIRVMRWTFDPRIARNAYFNLHRLGAVARHYLPDFYGSLASSLQGGLPTDRLLAEWVLTEEPESTSARLWDRAQPIVERIPLPAPPLTGNARRGSFAFAPDAQDAPGTTPAPGGEAAEARRHQQELGARLQSAFARGLQAVDFVPGAQGGGEYLLAASPPAVAPHR